MGINYTWLWKIYVTCYLGKIDKAIKAEENIGLILPCNIIIYEEYSEIIISAVKPAIAMQMITNKELSGIETEIEALIQKYN